MVVDIFLTAVCGIAFLFFLFCALACFNSDDDGLIPVSILCLVFTTMCGVVTVSVGIDLRQYTKFNTYFKGLSPEEVILNNTLNSKESTEYIFNLKDIENAVSVKVDNLSKKQQITNWSDGVKIAYINDDGKPGIISDDWMDDTVKSLVLFKLKQQLNK